MHAVTYDGGRDARVVRAGGRAFLGEDDGAVAVGGDDVEPAVVAAAVAGFAIEADAGRKGGGGGVRWQSCRVDDGDFPPDARLLLAVGEGQARLQRGAALGGSNKLRGAGEPDGMEELGEVVGGALWG